MSDQYSAEEFALAREFDAIRRGYGKPGVVKHYLAAHKLIWPEDDQHRWFVLGLTRICENKVTVFLGAASCVSGDTRILNPLTGEQPTIQELYEGGIAPTVLTLKGAVKAEIPFVKGVEDLYEVVLDNGKRFRATASHRVLAINGDFCHVSNLRCGSQLLAFEPCLPASNSEHAPSTHKQGVLCSQKKVEDFQADCLREYHFDDEQLLPAEETVQSFFPSQDDAQERAVCICNGEGVQDNTQKHNHSYQLFDHPSKRSGVQPFLPLENLVSRHVHAKTVLHDAPQFRFFRQFQKVNIPRHTFSKPTSNLRHRHSLCARRFLEISILASSAHCELPQQKDEIHAHTLLDLGLPEKNKAICGFLQPSGCNNESYPFKVSQSRVVSITKSHKETFYDLHVPGVHHYFAEGAIHHNSNKTYLFTVHALINFWVFPQTSLGILSTTDIISLERKVWGRLKKMFNRGRERFSWLEGFVLDSKRQITPDDIDDENEVARTLDHGIGTVACVSNGRFVGMGKFQGSKPPNSPGKNDGIMVHYGDECFPAGTMIDTPSGKIPIEKLKTGDSVFSAIGVSKIKATMSRTVEGLVKIRLKDGREIICTPNHRFFTQEGWKNSLHMNQSSYMLSTYEAMQILRNELPTREQQQVLPALPRKNDLGNLRSMRNYVHKNSHCFDQEILQSLLRVEIAPSKSRIQEEILHDISLRENLVVEAQAIFGASRGICRHAEKDGGRISGVQKIAFAGGKEENQHFNIQTSEINRPQAEDSRRKRDWPNQGGGGFIGSVFPSCEEQFSNQDGNEGGKWISNLLQARFGVSRNQAGGGSGRSIPFKTGQAISRCEENELSHGSWVDSIEVLEQEGFGGHSKCERGVKVYNLEIEGHPSYSVNGLLAHNCAVMAPSFLDAYANWMVNDGFKGVMGGNPTDISDPLCTAAEPRGGWDSFIDTGKTQEWTSRRYDAHVVAFDGRDTPNNDEPKNRYPYLITQKFIDLMASTHGLDSWQYFQQAIGKPSRGMVSNRVITIGLCEKHHAFESAAWKGTARTKLFSCDPAFGGGDRCVGGECEFGEDKDGNIIFAVGTPEIIPIRLNCGIEPEDQIAEFIFNQHKRLNIPPENFFYDSFGRGTLGNSFAKKFGSTCPIPVDSGAPTTERPVRFDLFIDEKNGERRLKTCKEHYSKFVTEMWFSTREAIESNQVRNLSMPVAQEGQLRLFRIVAGNKVEVESKDDMKERVKKSPDLYDYFAIALEGARRLGFRIERIGREVQSSKPDEDYFDNEVREWDAAINAGLLKH